jgi:hypothetical protein
MCASNKGNDSSPREITGKHLRWGSLFVQFFKLLPCRLLSLLL